MPAKYQMLLEKQNLDLGEEAKPREWEVHSCRWKRMVTTILKSFVIRATSAWWERLIDLVLQEAGEEIMGGFLEIMALKLRLEGWVGVCQVKWWKREHIQSHLGKQVEGQHGRNEGREVRVFQTKQEQLGEDTKWFWAGRVMPQLPFHSIFRLTVWGTEWQC